MYIITYDSTKNSKQTEAKQETERRMKMYEVATKRENSAEEERKIVKGKTRK